MREKEPATRVVFVRHGSTDFPKDRIYCDDREDPPLNAAGLSQAQAAAGLLAGEAVDLIIASPAARTARTAAAIQAATGASLQTDEALRERRFGAWDGLYFAEIERRHPEDYARWKQDQAGYAPAGGETVYELQRRLAGFLARVLADHAGRRLVVVAHVGPIRVALCDAVGLAVEHYRRLTIDYGSLSCVDYGRRQNNLIYLNRVGSTARV